MKIELLTAIKNNEKESVKFFLQQHLLSHEELNTLLDEAALGGHDEIAELIIEAMAEEEATSKNETAQNVHMMDIKETPIIYPNNSASFKKNSLSAYEPIAIISIGGRFPGTGDTLENFWTMLNEGRNGTSDIPDNRWNNAAYYSKDKTAPGKSYVYGGSFIQQSPQEFDADFFNIAPIEVKYMDPQQRILMECVWEALEYAHIDPLKLKGSATGIYIGAMTADYAELLNQLPEEEGDTAYTGVGNVSSVLSGRLSYWLGCQGPSVTLNTACSSSLVALHQACQSIHSSESHMAIVGGVNMMLSPKAFIASSKAQMLSADGKCKTFDVSADGYGRGEGCGVVILKSLSQAQADNDNILAVIRSSAVNQDGASSGLTVPNGPAQEKLIRTALEKANLSPNEIDYIEAHGTGTSLGDPIELNAIQNVFSTQQRESSLVVGTAKTYVGHLEAAAGITGLIKTILSLRHQKIPKLLHFKTLNPNIKLNENIQLAIEPQSWPFNENRKRRAGISSFGFSGTNAHVILEEGPQQNLPLESIEDKNPQLIVLSAKTETALQVLKAKYVTYLQTTEDRLQDIAYTSAIGRTHFQHRFVLVVKAIAEAIENLKKSESILESENLTLNQLAKTYLAGEKIDWLTYYADKAKYCQKVQLPMYAFQRQRYWALDNIKRSHSSDTYFKKTNNSFLEGPLSIGNGQFMYVHTLTEEEITRLAGHVIFDTPIIPGPAYIGLMLMACQAYRQQEVLICVDVEIVMPMMVQSGAHYQIVLQPTEENKINVSFYGSYSQHAEQNQWQLHAKAIFKSTALDLTTDENVLLPTLLEKCPNEINKAAFYQGVAARGFHYQENFQGVDTFHYAENQLISKVLLGPQQQGVTLDPVALDICLHAGLGLLLIRETPLEEAYLPVGMEQIEIYQPLPAVGYVYATWSTEATISDYIRADVALYDPDGKLVFRCVGVVIKQTKANHLHYMLQESFKKQSGNQPPSLSYMSHWEKLPVNTSQLVSSETWVIILENSTQLSLMQKQINAIYPQAHYICLDQQQEEKLAEITSIQDTLSVLYFCDGWNDLESSHSPYEASLKSSHSLLTCVQQLSKVLQKTDSRFWVVTQQVNAVPEDKPIINLAQTAVKGFMRALILERPEADIKHIDIGSEFDQGINQLLQEMQMPHRESELSYRHDETWIEQLIPQEITTTSASAIKTDCTYVVTGGLGGIGWSLCTWLLNKGACHIVLLGRRAIDETKQAELNVWSTQNKQVMYYACDISSEIELTAVLEKISNTLPAISGVFHAAGVISIKPLMEQNREDFAAGFQSKIQGTWLLYQLLHKRYAKTLEFMILFSSISSSLGSPGMLSYAASNGFMDGFAEAVKQQSSCRVVSMNWGPWADVGMITQFEEKRASARLGLIPIPPNRGLEILEKTLLASQLTTVTVTEIDWEEANRVIPKAVARVKGISFNSPHKTISVAWSETLMSLSDEERKQAIEKKLKTLVGQISQIDVNAIDVQRGFAEMGFDSLMTMELKNHLQKLMNNTLNLSSTLVFDYPNICELSKYLFNQLTRENTQQLMPLPIKVPSVSPRTIIEEQLVKMFKEQFKIKELGVFDSLQEIENVKLSQWLTAYTYMQALVTEFKNEIMKLISKKAQTSEEADNLKLEMDILRKINIAEVALYISCLIEFNTDIGNDPFFIAVRKNNTSMLSLFLKKSPEKINMLGISSKISLHLAVQLKNIEMALWLISQGAHIDQKTQLGVTPLTLALFSQEFNLVKVFLEYLPNIDPEMFSLTSDKMMQCYLLGAKEIREFIIESELFWAAPLKVNLENKKLFYQGVSSDLINKMLPFMSANGKMFIEHLILVKLKEVSLNTVGMFSSNLAVVEGSSNVNVLK